MTAVHHPHAPQFAQGLLRSAKVTLEHGETLYFYFNATKGAGTAECFVKDASGGVRMLVSDSGLFDFIYAEWRQSNSQAGACWSWGWAEFDSSSGSNRIEFFDDPLDDEAIGGIEHARAWRKERFGLTRIIFPQRGQK